MDIRSLLSTLKDVLVGSLINLLHLISAEDNSLYRPVVMLHVVNLRSDGCDDTEVVASSLHTPPQVGLAIDRLQFAVREHHVHGEKLSGSQTIATLKPPVAATKGRSQVANAFTTSSD